MDTRLIDIRTNEFTYCMYIYNSNSGFSPGSDTTLVCGKAVRNSSSDWPILSDSVLRMFSLPLVPGKPPPMSSRDRL